VEEGWKTYQPHYQIQLGFYFFYHSCHPILIGLYNVEKQLLEVICFQLQRLKPENVPKPPYNTTCSNGTGPDSTKLNNSTTSNKGKQPAAMKSKSPAAPQHQQRGGRRLPVPPEPHPLLGSRLSTYSPAISTGVLIETVKAGMNAAENSVMGAGPGAPPTAAKGKRKVVRVRG
jgi:signal recognition particle subunit SRP19